MNIQIRDVRVDDLPRLLEIYSHFVEHTAISFEYVTPSLTEFRRRMDDICAKYPYLVAEVDGLPMGYAYAKPFVGRAAYGWGCELTIYLDPTAQKCGLGRALYETLEERLKRQGILNLYACIGWPEREDEYLNRNSADFHAHMGFALIGHFHRCGYKFSRWYDMVWMEKIIGDHQSEQPPVRPYEK